MSSSYSKENTDQQPLLSSSSAKNHHPLPEENGMSNNNHCYESISNAGNNNTKKYVHQHSNGSSGDNLESSATERINNVHHNDKEVIKQQDEENDRASLIFEKKTSDTTTMNNDGGGGDKRKHFATLKSGSNTNDDDDDKDRTKNQNIILSLSKSINRNAVHFGARLCVLLTFSSLFVLVHDPDDDDAHKIGKGWPSGSWVYITTLMVCWFPQLDAASVIEKSMQRCMGTVVGGLLSLLCGFAALKLDLKYPYHSIFLGFEVALVTFCVGFFSSQVALSRKSKFIDQFSYATVLCLLTFGIGFFPFTDSYAEGQWKKACFRLQNVIIGCIVGCVGSVVVLPRPTTLLLHERIEKQCKLAGEASEAVLFASADVFSGQAQPMGFVAQLISMSKIPRRSKLSRLKDSFVRLNRDILEEEGDVALEKYETAIGDWKKAKGLFSKLRFDPFHFGVSLKEKEIFKERCAMALARGLRIQTTVVLLDGIIRNDPRHDYFTDEVVALFVETGTLIRKMLTVPLLKESSQQAKDKLVENLTLIRKGIIRLSAKVSEQSKFLEHPIGAIDEGDELDDDNDGNTADGGALYIDTDRRRGSIVYDDSHLYSLFFLQLVEHLILRCCSLYDTWIKLEEAAIPFRKIPATAANFNA